MKAGMLDTNGQKGAQTQPQILSNDFIIGPILNGTYEIIISRFLGKRGNVVIELV